MMDLTAVDGATNEEKAQKLTEWAKAFTAKNWKEAESIDNAAIREAVKQMRVVMSTPDQRQIVWNRKLAEIDYRSQAAEERRKGSINTLGELVKDGLLTLPEAAKRSGLSEKEFLQQTGLKG